MTHSPIRKLLSLSVATVALFVLGHTSSAQSTPPTAAEVANFVQTFYDQTKTLTASFHQTQYTKVYKKYTRAKGKVAFKKPGKMRFDYAKPNGQVFVSNGERLWIYQPPDEGETKGQVIERAMNEDQLPQAFSFLTGTGRLDRDFNLRLLNAKKQGFENGHVLELRPKKPSPNYEKVLFFVRVIEKNGKKAGIVQRTLIIDAQGNRNRFDFKKMKFNRPVKDDVFVFTAPANTRTINP